MKQKYSITKDMEKQQLIINEYAELDKEIMSLLCSQVYDIKTIQEALPRGQEALIQAIRTINFYPPFFYANAIASNVMTILNTDNQDYQPIELIFDDADYLTKIQDGFNELENFDDEPESIDELLDDDIEDTFDDDETLGNINSPLKIADDEVLDIEDDI